LRGRPALSDEHRSALAMLEPSLRHMPDPTDSERPKTYVARNPYRTPAYFPAAPAQIFDDPQIFEKFQADLLFFIFYFQQGTDGPDRHGTRRHAQKQHCTPCLPC
jgi:CCR4-NOT transcriptional regulation complex NOT5 subunit